MSKNIYHLKIQRNRRKFLIKQLKVCLKFLFIFVTSSFNFHFFLERETPRHSKNMKRKTVSFSNPVQEFLPVHRKLIVLAKKFTLAEIERIINNCTDFIQTEPYLNTSDHNSNLESSVLTRRQKIQFRKPSIYVDRTEDLDESENEPTNLVLSEPPSTMRFLTPSPEPMPSLEDTEMTSLPEENAPNILENAVSFEPVITRARVVIKRLVLSPEILTTYEQLYSSVSDQPEVELDQTEEPESLSLANKTELNNSMLTSSNASENYEPNQNKTDGKTEQNQQISLKLKMESDRFKRYSVHISDVDILADGTDYRCLPIKGSLKSGIDTEETSLDQQFETQNNVENYSEPLEYPEHIIESSLDLCDHLETVEEFPKIVSVTTTMSIMPEDDQLVQAQETNDLNQTKPCDEPSKEVISEKSKSENRKRNRRFTINCSEEPSEVISADTHTSLVKRKKLDIYDFEESSVSSSDTKLMLTPSKHITIKSLSSSETTSKDRPLIRKTDLHELSPNLQSCSNVKLQKSRRKSVFDSPNSSESLYKKNLKILSSTRSKTIPNPDIVPTPTFNQDISLKKQETTDEKSNEEIDSKPLSARLPPRRLSTVHTAFKENKKSRLRSKSIYIETVMQDKPLKNSPPARIIENSSKPSTSKQAVDSRPMISTWVEDKNFLPDSEPAAKPRIRVRGASLFQRVEDKLKAPSPIPSVKQVDNHRFKSFNHSVSPVPANKRLSEIEEPLIKRTRTQRNSDNSYSTSPCRSESPGYSFQTDYLKNKMISKKIHTTGEDSIFEMASNNMEVESQKPKMNLRVCLSKCILPEESLPNNSLETLPPESIETELHNIPEPPESTTNSEFPPENPLEPENLENSQEQEFSDVDSDDLPLRQIEINSAEQTILTEIAEISSIPDIPAIPEIPEETENEEVLSTYSPTKTTSKLSIPLNLLDMNKIVLPFDKNNPGPAFVQSDQESYDPTIHCSLFSGFVRSEQEPPDFKDVEYAKVSINVSFYFIWTRLK